MRTKSVELGKDLVARGAVAAEVITYDAASPESTAAAARTVVELGFDVALIAHGVLNGPERCSPEALTADVCTNYLSYAIIGECLAVAIESLPKSASASKTLVFVSSVAGDRGRRSNYLYGATKAAVSAYASGLRGRLCKSGANVLTVKPGFVDTPMTAQFRKGILFASAERVGRGIVDAVNTRASIVYLPGFWRFIMSTLAHVPERLFHRLPI